MKDFWLATTSVCGTNIEYLPDIERKKKINTKRVSWANLKPSRATY